MASRLQGVETELAFHFQPAGGGELPTHPELYDALVEALGVELTWAGPRQDDELKRRWFATNGFSVCFEHQEDSSVGLFEVATPECEGPEALALRLRAADDALVRALPRAEAALAGAGRPGTLTLIKGSRDVDGEVFGRQDNIEVTVVSAALAPVWWALVLMLMAGTATCFTVLMVWILVNALHWATLVDDDPEVTSPPHGAGRSAACGRPAPVPLHARLARRAVVGGVPPRARAARGLPRLPGRGDGGRAPRGRRHALAVRQGRGDHALVAERPRSPAWRDGGAGDAQPRQARHPHPVERVGALFGRRQRLQIGVADSNRCETAEVLAVTGLARVVELAERGGLRDAPRFADPPQPCGPSRRTRRSRPPSPTGRAVRGPPWSSRATTGPASRRPSPTTPWWPCGASCSRGSGTTGAPGSGAWTG
ncbi:MAG: proteasome accessory factor PafA2 family protein [Alphaproteobacteria bacterium]|nr:proteasome accessory factor PafA2 family protein [Alphaproteobacteria bacterium]